MEAELQFEVNCSSNYYGSHCDVECQERNDSLGHYLCNSDGSKECLEGYENVETNCIECIAADGCCELIILYYCYVDYNIQSCMHSSQWWLLPGSWGLHM